MRFRFSHVVVCAGALGVAGCAGGGAETVAPDAAAPATRRPPPPLARSFTAFETGRVRPLAISADRRWLYASREHRGAIVCPPCLHVSAACSGGTPSTSVHARGSRIDVPSRNRTTICVRPRDMTIGRDRISRSSPGHFFGEC
jgi:hypothetical protein